MQISYPLARRSSIALSSSPRPIPITRPTHLSPEQPNSIHILSSSIPKEDSILQASQPKRPRLKWHCGIRSKSSPTDIMLELYRAMYNTGIKWKNIDHFRVRCLFRQPTTKQDIRFEWVLYRMGDAYLVDFRAREESDKNTFGFLDVCCRVIKELAISG